MSKRLFWAMFLALALYGLVAAVDATPVQAQGETPWPEGTEVWAIARVGFARVEGAGWAPIGREMGVTRIDGNYAVVSWDDTQKVSLTTGQWRLVVRETVPAGDETKVNEYLVVSPGTRTAPFAKFGTYGYAGFYTDAEAEDVIYYIGTIVKVKVHGTRPNFGGYWYEKLGYECKVLGSDARRTTYTAPQ